MTAIPWIRIFIFLFICPFAQNASFCNTKGSIDCNTQKYHIVVTNITTPSDPKEILEKCMGKEKCNVVATDECVYVDYWCKPKAQIFEITDSSDLSTSQPLSQFDLMSKDYGEAQYMQAPVINCTIKFADNEHFGKLRIMVYELAPFAASTDYCLFTINNPEPLMCSGSQVMMKSFRPFEINTGWTFRMQLTSNATSIPVRFWIGIFVSVSANQDSSYHLECLSSQASIEIFDNSSKAPIELFENNTKAYDNSSNDSIGRSDNSFTVSLITFGGVLLSLIPVFLIGVICYLNCASSFGPRRQLPPQDPIYYDIIPGAMTNQSMFPQTMGSDAVPGINQVMESAVSYSRNWHLRDADEEDRMEDGSEASGSISIYDNALYGSTVTSRHSAFDKIECVDSNNIYGACFPLRAHLEDFVEIDSIEINRSEITIESFHSDESDSIIIDNAVCSYSQSESESESGSVLHKSDAVFGSKRSL